MRLRLSPSVESESRKTFRTILAGLPCLAGDVISLRALPELVACRGKLLSGNEHRGAPVHAAAFIRKRCIVVESALLKRPAKLRLILIHELFHFVWVRANNSRRDEFAALLIVEITNGARGELGESAAGKKAVLQEADFTHRNSRWRDYICESFCDTAAWFYSGRKKHAELTLGKRWQEQRRRWFLAVFLRPPAC